MPRYECLATNLRAPTKINLHQTIEADSAKDALRVFGRFVGEWFRKETEMVSGAGLLEAFGLSRVTSEEVERFVLDLVKASSRVRSGEGGVEFTAGYAELGTGAPFLVHTLTRDSSPSD